MYEESTSRCFADLRNQLGTVPNYGISPVDGQLVDGVYFYKDLSRPPTGV